jgi:hypothetical protein
MVLDLQPFHFVLHLINKKKLYNWTFVCIHDQIRETFLLIGTLT